jgi:ribosome assembly protein YihI (activator of Der GTPase)
MKNIHNKQQTDINNLSPIEELEMATHHATDAVLDLIRNINALPVEQRQHITDMFDRVKDGKSKDV